jgi:fucose permease
VYSATNPSINRWRLAAAGIFFLLTGLNDAATGALIPYLEEEYNIGYGIVSLIFVANAVGFISMAPICQAVDGRLGRARSYITACSLMIAGYISLACAPPFPMVVASFFLLGLGMALFLSFTNAWIVNLMHGTVILGTLHGLYGVGST